MPAKKNMNDVFFFAIHFRCRRQHLILSAFVRKFVAKKICISLLICDQQKRDASKMQQPFEMDTRIAYNRQPRNEWMWLSLRAVTLIQICCARLPTNDNAWRKEWRWNRNQIGDSHSWMIYGCDRWILPNALSHRLCLRIMCVCCLVVFV